MPSFSTLTVGPVYVPGATTIVSPGEAASTAAWIEAVLPVAGTLIVAACVAAGSSVANAASAGSEIHATVRRMVRPIVGSLLRVVHASHRRARPGIRRTYSCASPGCKPGRSQRRSACTSPAVSTPQAAVTTAAATSSEP